MGQNRKAYAQFHNGIHLWTKWCDMRVVFVLTKKTPKYRIVIKSKQSNMTLQVSFLYERCTHNFKRRFDFLMVRFHNISLKRRWSLLQEKDGSSHT